ncbi:prevent-host-death family protein [Rhizobium petrolearium]|uniref:type II toxin-antitoxin system prevent-host-death family antitoxin n=1 Tax=Neorhizobium TaxID=1525371 RepID=UPI001FDC0CE6|nr:prevent-host-death family protein [Neorhizobium petrolearium]
MKILVETTEAAERLEELIELSVRQDEILICRKGRPIAALTSIARENGTMDAFLRLAAEGRGPLRCDLQPR